MNEQVRRSSGGLGSKVTWQGHRKRCELLASVGLDPRDFNSASNGAESGEALESTRPDDVLDAIAAAWVAEKWLRETATRLGPEAVDGDYPIWT